MNWCLYEITDKKVFVYFAVKVIYSNENWTVTKCINKIWSGHKIKEEKKSESSCVSFEANQAIQV